MIFSNCNNHLYEYFRIYSRAGSFKLGKVEYFIFITIFIVDLLPVETITHIVFSILWFYLTFIFFYIGCS